MLDANKPLPAPMLTQIYVTTWRQKLNELSIYCRATEPIRTRGIRLYYLLHSPLANVAAMLKV